MNRTNLISQTGWRCLTIGITAIVSFASEAVSSAEAIDPNATRILQSMSAYLAATPAFSVNTDIGWDVVTPNGQKLQLSSVATVAVQRPGSFFIQRQGPVAQAEFIFDGKTLTVHGKRSNVYTQMTAPGTIDNAIRVFELQTGFPAPGADLLFANPYAILSEGVESSTYLGKAYVNGVECHHLAFREAEVDWQLWVQTGDRPLPLKYTITSKWQTAAPQYEMRLRDWVTNPQIKANQFTFSAPPGARKLPALPASELDEFTPTPGGQS
ncbi:MAG: DUF2092 domain-containing protein [Leptolyngbyaceae cyanobacterium bins.349]|nr:DUF2092 domain-containing protein [Leptolyngbyaceae cyanobacterium bins.349]